MSDSTTKPGPLISRASEENLVPGRREFLFFRDFGLRESTDGRHGAVLIKAKEGMKRATGWHYHECELQMLYWLNGWSEMEFEDGTRTRFGVGDFCSIPGGMVHQEIETSDDLEVIEITMPAVIGTVPVDPPTPAG